MRTLSAFALALALAPAAAQDAARVNPKIVSVVFEDARVRVLRVRLAPHETLAMHSHPAKAVVCITTNDTRITRADGAVSDNHCDAGKISWSAPVQHAVENLSARPIDNIEIEFKQAAEPAVEVHTQPSPRNPPGSEPIPVEQEPHHHWTYENQYVRMLEVKLGPGETTLMHTHSHDNVAVRLSEATIQRQDAGKEWSPAAKVAPGEATFTEGAKRPYTHRLKNVGATTFHVIDIELLQ